METLAMAPVWSQNGSELLTTLDNLYAAKSLLDTYILQATRRLDEMGTAQELGARDTVELARDLLAIVGQIESWVTTYRS
jgi:hypothetical protein